MGKKSLVKKVTYGVLGSIVDLLLWNTALIGSSIGKTGPSGIYKSFKEADQFLEEINHRTIILAWHQITKKRLVTLKKRNNLYNPEITRFGRERLSSVLPKYHKIRPWDKKIFIITYDIEEKAHKKRDNFRYFLLKISCKKIAESAFVTPYNPRELINEFVKEHNIPGIIIVSDLGKEGGIGEMKIQDLMVKLFNLNEINIRYEELLKEMQDKHKVKPYRYLLFKYLSILKDDPQLPFELLPTNWSGNKAYQLYEDINNKYINEFAAGK